MVVKKEKVTAAHQLKLSVTPTVAVKKKTSTLTLIFMNQLTWPLVNFLFLKQIKLFDLPVKGKF